LRAGSFARMFDGSLPEIGDLAALDDAALVDAAAGWARTENAACARKTAVMAELFARRTGLPAGERELWWVDPQAAVGAELGAAQNISTWMALAQAHRGVVLADRLPKVAALFAAGLISEMVARAIEYRTALVTDDEAIARVDALLAEHVTPGGRCRSASSSRPSMPSSIRSIPARCAAPARRRVSGMWNSGRRAMRRGSPVCGPGCMPRMRWCCSSGWSRWRAGSVRTIRARWVSGAATR
jgi:hypothetical protein